MPAFGRYEIKAPLGRGGFATVYRAHDPALARDVALKVLLPHLAQDPDIHRRFLAEARALARLRHPGIVTVFDVGEAEGVPFFAMQLVDGLSLQERLARDISLEPAEVLTIVGAVADALDYAHGAGLVHRDVKPANVMIDPSGHVLLMDFGIARALDGAQQTMTGAALLTPTYAAPEQVRGERVGPAADIYALACLTYHLIAGRPPFEGDTWAVMHAQVTQPPPPLPSPRGALPPHVPAAVAHALAKNPADRPSSARAFFAELEGADPQRAAATIVSSESRTAAPPTAVAPPPVSSAGGPGATLDAGSARRQPPPSPVRVVELWRWDGPSGPMHGISAVALMPGQMQALSGTDAGAARVHELRAGEPIHRFTQPHMSVISVAVSSNGRLGLTGHSGRGAPGEPNLRVWDLSLGRELPPLNSHTDDVLGVTFVGGGAVSCSADGTVRIWDVASRREVMRPLTGHDGAVTGLAVSPDGATLLTAGDDGTMRLWDLHGGRELARMEEYEPMPSFIFKPAFSPDGRRAVIANLMGVVSVWDLTTRRRICSMNGHVGNVFGAMFMPDGRRILSWSGTDFYDADTMRITGGPDNTIRMWDAESGQELARLYEADRGSVTALDIGEGGSVILAGSGEGTLRLFALRA